MYIDDICFDVFKLFLNDYIYDKFDRLYIRYEIYEIHDYNLYISTIMYVYVFDQHDFVL